MAVAHLAQDDRCRVLSSALMVDKRAGGRRYLLVVITCTMLLHLAQPSQAEERRSGLVLDVNAGIAPLTWIFVSSDSAGPDGVGPALGLGTALSVRVQPWLELGVGLRYDFTLSSDAYAHVVALPARLALIASGNIHVAVAGGLAAAAFQQRGSYADSDAILSTGVMFELAVGYERAWQSGKTLLFQVGVRFDPMTTEDTDRGLYTDGSPSLQAQLGFVRAGFRWY